MQVSQELVAAFSEAAYLVVLAHPPALTGTAGGPGRELWAADPLGHLVRGCGRGRVA